MDRRVCMNFLLATSPGSNELSHNIVSTQLILSVWQSIEVIFDFFIRAIIRHIHGNVCFPESISLYPSLTAWAQHPVWYEVHTRRWLTQDRVHAGNCFLGRSFQNYVHIVVCLRILIKFLPSIGLSTSHMLHSGTGSVDAEPVARL